MFRSILVPLDGSSFSDHALPLAIGIARRAGALVQLAHVHVDTQPSAQAEDAPERRRERAYLEARAAWLNGAGCHATTITLLDGRSAHHDSVEVMPDNRWIATALHDHAGDSGVDLVVMTTHGRGGVARMVLGSVADALVRRMPVPVLLVRPQQTPPDLLHEQVFTHVLIPLDGSPRAEAVLDHAAALCSLMNARCTLLQAMDPLLAGHTIPPYTFGLMRQEVEQVQAESRAYLTRMAERLQLPYVQTHFVVAEPAAAITTYAREHAVDLIAMTTHSHRMPSRIVLGSVADMVVRRADAAVLLYRPPVDI